MNVFVLCALLTFSVRAYTFSRGACGACGCTLSMLLGMFSIDCSTLDMFNECAQCSIRWYFH